MNPFDLMLKVKSNMCSPIEKLKWQAKVKDPLTGTVRILRMVQKVNLF